MLYGARCKRPIFQQPVIMYNTTIILYLKPYFNEAGYERQKGTQQGKENSRMYNEMAVLKMVQSLCLLAQNPPVVFKDEIIAHLKDKSDRLISRLQSWLEISQYQNSQLSNTDGGKAVEESINKLSGTTPEKTAEVPEFPLLPGSKGFCISLRKAIKQLKEAVNEMKT